MTQGELMQFLLALDYSGKLVDVLARLSDDHLAAFAEAHNYADYSAHVYFGVRRLGVERGTPGEVPISAAEQARRIVQSAVKLLTMETMRRAGNIRVEYPETPFIAPAQALKIEITEKGRARQAELERRAMGSDRY